MKKLGGVYFILFVLLVLILVNFIGSFQFFRVDLTEEKIHSLSPKTIEILKSDSLIEDELKFEIYLEGDLPPDLRKVQLAIREKLDEFRAYGGDKIYYEFINPSENVERKDEIQTQLQEFGLLPTIISTFSKDSKKDMKVFGGIVLRAPGNKVAAIQILQPSFRPVQIPRQEINNAINDLEYRLLEGVYKVTAPDKKKIAFLQGHGELSETERADVSYELSKFHIVEDVTINGKIKALDQFDALIVAKPTQPIPDKDQYIIDQFIMNGGKVAWLIDVVDVAKDTLIMRGETLGLERDLNRLDQQIFNYGARINKNLLVDANSGFMYFQEGREWYNWYYYPAIKTSWRKNIIVDNVDPVLLKYSSTIDILKNKSVIGTKLLFSSDLSTVYNTPVRINFNMLKQEPEMIRSIAKPYQVVACMLEGEFNSHFRNRMTDNFLKKSGLKQKNKSVKNKMLVISDGDIIRNSVDSLTNRRGQTVARPYALGRNPNDIYNQLKPTYGNREFFVNAMESLLGTEDLIPLRSKSITQRPLDSVKIEAEKNYWQILNALIPILVVLTFGLFHFMLRRKKFTS